jgi:hypothetical protein
VAIDLKGDGTHQSPYTAEVPITSFTWAIASMVQAGQSACIKEDGIVIEIIHLPDGTFDAMIKEDTISATSLAMLVHVLKALLSYKR